MKDSIEHTTEHNIELVLDTVDRIKNYFMNDISNNNYMFYRRIQNGISNPYRSCRRIRF